MELYFTASFIRSYKKLSPEIREKADKALDLLLKNFRYPSLRCKKYNEEEDIWQGRVNRSYRFYFLIKGNAYILLEVKSHPK